MKQRHVPSIQKVQKTVEVPQVQYIDRVVDVPVMKQRHVPSVQRVQKPVMRQRHVPSIQKVQKPVAVPVIETIEKIIDVPVIKHVEVPQIQTIEKVVEIPQIQTVEKVVEIPEVQALAGTTTSVNVPSAPVRQTAPAEVFQVTEVGPPLAAVSAPATRSQAPMAAVPGMTMAAPAMAHSFAPAGMGVVAAPMTMSAPMAMNTTMMGGTGSYVAAPPAMGMGAGSFVGAPMTMAAPMAMATPMASMAVPMTTMAAPMAQGEWIHHHHHVSITTGIISKLGVRDELGASIEFPVPAAAVRVSFVPLCTLFLSARILLSGTAASCHAPSPCVAF